MLQTYNGIPYTYVYGSFLIKELSLWLGSLCLLLIKDNAKTTDGTTTLIIQEGIRKRTEPAKPNRTV